MREKIIKYPITSFFVITFTITWPLISLVIFIFPGNMLAEGIFGSIATFGPALSGIIVSSVLNGKKTKKQTNKKVWTFIITWIISAAVMLLFSVNVRNSSLQIGLIVFSAILALLPAYIISSAYSSKPLVSNYLNTIVKPRGHFLWYLIALFIFPVFQFAGYCIAIILGDTPGEFIQGELNMILFSSIILTFLLGVLFQGGINEEAGWRGFAIPRIQKRFSPLTAAIIVWFFWALWHLLYDIHTAGSVSEVLLNRLVFNIFWSVLFVWIFNRTKGSILAVSFIHSSMNTSSEFFAVTDYTGILFGILIVTIIISDKMWKRADIYKKSVL